MGNVLQNGDVRGVKVCVGSVESGDVRGEKVCVGSVESGDVRGQCNVAVSVEVEVAMWECILKLVAIFQIYLEVFTDV